MRMKRQDGGFAVCQGGEVDVRLVGYTVFFFLIGEALLTFEFVVVFSFEGESTAFSRRRRC